MSPLTLAKSKRWQPAIESSRGSPDRCAERECVQKRWRAAHEEENHAAHRHCFFCAGFFCAGFSVPPCSVRVTLRDSSAGPTGSPLFVSKAFYSLSWSVQGKSAVVLYLPSTLSLSNHALQQHSLSRMHMHMSLHSITSR